MRDNSCHRLNIFHTRRYVSQPSILCQDLNKIQRLNPFLQNPQGWGLRNIPVWTKHRACRSVNDWMVGMGNVMRKSTKDVTMIINSIFSNWHKDILWKFNQGNNLSHLYIYFATLRITFILTTFQNSGNLTMCYRQWSLSLIKYRRWYEIDL